MGQDRIARLVPRLIEAGVGALLVSQPTNILYLSRFRGSSGCLVVTPTRRFVITDFRYHERVGAEVDPSFELVDESGLDRAGVLAALLASLGIGRAAYESDVVTVAFHERLARSGMVTWIGVQGWVDALRAVKEPEEVERIRRAVAMGERIYIDLLPMIGPRTTEADLAAEIEYRARKLGAQGCSFPPIVASGSRGAQPHAGFSTAKIEPETPLVLDLGVILDDYCSDMTRTVFLGGCPSRWREIYNLVREAKEMAFNAIRPGVPAREVDAVARRHIAAAGYGDRFRHGLGHGVGLPFKGAPTLHWTSEDVLQCGHVASNEPGIYLPGEGGVRIEDLFVVRDTGAEYLNRLGTELTIVG